VELTPEQTKEFWEKLGFQFVPRKESPRFGGEQDYWAVYDHWIYPDGSRHKELPKLTGIEALGNLFKWAVPEAVELIGNTSQRTNEEAMTLLFGLWLKEFWTPRPAPISIQDALFWAIDKTRKGEG